MKLLLVEDDENKRARVLDFLSKSFPELEVDCAYSLISGIRKARTLCPDLVLLDMTLPNYDPEAGAALAGMHPFGGEEFLRQIRRSDLIAHVVVLTQFETFGEPPYTKGLAQLDEELRDKYPQNYRGSIYYHASISEWVQQLSGALKQLENEVLRESSNS